MPGEALRLYQALFPDLERVLRPDHPATLTTRNNVAGWTFECGDAGEALRLFQALLPDLERVLGRPGYAPARAARRAKKKANLSCWRSKRHWICSKRSCAGRHSQPRCRLRPNPCAGDCSGNGRQ